MRVCPRCRSVYASTTDRCGIDGESLVQQPHDPLIGGTLDRYRILESLGSGGMGCVYRARHTVIEREYAIKVLFGEYGADAKLLARFKREAQSISKIRHPNIVVVEDFGTTSVGLTFLVMELVRGKTLAEAIETDAPIPPVRTAQIARQVANGLGAAHAQGFVHRDVKPSNVMLTREDDGEERVKILDFGAVSLRSLPSNERLTAIGHIIGTPTYMAPEQTQDPGVGPTADLYALGVMMFEMLKGEPPFTGAGRAEVLVKHIMEEAPPAPPSGGLEQIVRRLLRKHPRERPQSAEELVAAIDELDLIPGLHHKPRVSAEGRAESFHTAPTYRVELEEGSRAELRALYDDALVAEPGASPTAPTPLVESRRDVMAYDTFPSLTPAADPAESVGWTGWEDGEGLAYPGTTTRQVAPSPSRTRPEKDEIYDTTDPRIASTPSPRTDALSKHSVLTLGPVSTQVVRERDEARNTEHIETDSTSDVLFEPERPDRPARSQEDDAGPTQVDFRMEFDEAGAPFSDAPNALMPVIHRLDGDPTRPLLGVDEADTPEDGAEVPDARGLDEVTDPRGERILEEPPINAAPLDLDAGTSDDLPRLPSDFFLAPRPSMVSDREDAGDTETTVLEPDDQPVSTLEIDAVRVRPSPVAAPRVNNQWSDASRVAKSLELPPPPAPPRRWLLGAAVVLLLAAIGILTAILILDDRRARLIPFEAPSGRSELTSPN